MDTRSASPRSERQPRSKDRAGEGQLALLEDPEAVWRLDDHTREVGRQGVAAARAALRRALGPLADADRGARRAA
jgi:hypothetical protein